jgi:hypothetical protein
MFASCSGPKYTASFNSYQKSPNYVQVQPQHEQNVLAPSLEPEQVLASASSAPVEIKNAPKEEVRKTYLQMDKTERKALRQQLKTDIKSYVKEHKKNMSVESTKATKGMDNDLKLASIFGAVGIVAMFIGGEVFWIIGGIALIIGVVFFVKWLIRQ